MYEKKAILGKSGEAAPIFGCERSDFMSDDVESPSIYSHVPRPYTYSQMDALFPAKVLMFVVFVLFPFVSVIALFVVVGNMKGNVNNVSLIILTS